MSKMKTTLIKTVLNDENWVCPNCKHGLHDEAVAALVCSCPCLAASDARQDLTDWLSYSVGNVKELRISLLRAHQIASHSEPIVAMVLLPIIKDARRIERRLNELIGVR